MTLPTFSDESSTGKDSEAFRGLRRATIAARVDDANNFDWFRRYCADYVPDGAEAKADLVLQIADGNPEARALLMGNIGRATIIIVDLAEHYRRLLSALAEPAGRPPLTHAQSAQAVTNLGMQRIGRDLLAVARDLAVYRTMIPQERCRVRSPDKGAPLSPIDIRQRRGVWEDATRDRANQLHVERMLRSDGYKQ